MSGYQLTMYYIAFAVIATVINLGTQRLVLSFGDDALWLSAAIIAGTLSGLVVKYLLDKKWIFVDTQTGIKAHGKQFTLYTLMGGFTTLIFWGFEAGFWYVWRSDMMRELGAVIGLAIGYAIKYQLDKRFVFTQAPQKEFA